jgi:hypothetical protein
MTPCLGSVVYHLGRVGNTLGRGKLRPVFLIPQAPGAGIRPLGYAITLFLHGCAIPGYRDGRAALQLFISEKLGTEPGLSSSSVPPSP